MSLKSALPTVAASNPAITALQHHVTGAIERGETQPIAAIDTPPAISAPILLATNEAALPAHEDPLEEGNEPESPDTRRNKGKGTGTGTKSRAAMGVKEDEIIVWAPVIMPKTTRELLLNCAKHRNLTMPIYCCSTFIRAGLDAAMPEIEKEAAEYAALKAIAEGPRTPKKLATMTPDQLRAFVNAQKELQAQAQAMLDALSTTTEGGTDIE